MSKKHIIILALLILLATSWRIINHNYSLAPNLELVTVASVLAAIIIGWRGALVVPLVTMAVSDAIIGTSPIIIASWSTFALIGLAALILKRFNDRPFRQIIAGAGFATISSTLFFLITNFGVWLQGFGVYYPGTLSGLGTSYVMGLPFYRTMLIGNLIAVPSAIAVFQLVKAYSANKSAIKQTV